MEKMLVIKERRKMISDFISVSVAMITGIHFFMLFTNWMQCKIFSTATFGELVMDIFRIFGCFFIILIAGMIFDKLQNRYMCLYRK